MGTGRTAVRHLDHLVPCGWRFLHRLYRDRGAGAGLCGRRLRLLRAALHDHRLSLRVCVMPLLWKVAHRAGYVTAADVVHGAYGSRALELAVALTGMVATMPYIALQLVGMGTVIKAMGLSGEL